MKITNPFLSAFASTCFARIALGVGVSTVAIASMMLPQAASAQSAPGNIQSFPDASRQNERDSFGGNLGGGDFNIFQMIHQSQLGGMRDMSEYSQQQNRNLNNAAEEFKRQQRALMGNPEPQLPDNPDSNNQLENPQGN
jgi:hypothetical protein